MHNTAWKRRYSSTRHPIILACLYGQAAKDAARLAKYRHSHSALQLLNTDSYIITQMIPQ